MLRLRTALLVTLTILAAVPSLGVRAADPARVLRVALGDVTSLDPQQGTDLRSTRVASHIFEALYEFDYFATPARIVPNTAEALPQISADGLTWTIRLKKGIRFTDDPAFKGVPRELVAQDYVYSITRRLDPNLRGGGDAALTDLFAGARPVVDAARKPGARLDYDAPIAGLRAIDRHTLQLKLTHVDYTLLEQLALLNTMAVAREAIEAAGADVMRKPVGTGPYRLAEFRTGSRVVLEANPHYRALSFPASANPAHQALVASMQGRRLPALDRIEISIIEETTPEFLAFDQNDLDILGVGGDTAARVLDGDRLKPAYAQRGIAMQQFRAPYLTFTYFNMDDPVVGGYTPQQIALRRAVDMGFNTDELIKVLFRGLALPANQLLPPQVSGHDPGLPYKSPYDPQAARALLDRFGFKDRDGDGYRETPDGKPLTLVRGTLPESWYREADTLWKKNMDAIGLRMEVEQKKFAELLNLSLAGKLPMFNLGYRSLDPTGFEILQTLWSKAPPDTNRAHFRNADYDAAYEKFLRTPDGPQRVALARKMSEIAATYVPMTLHTFAIGVVLVQPWVEGYWPTAFGLQWKYLDVNPARRAAAKR
jgi:ABC-type transport system substrate-binding protein